MRTVIELIQFFLLFIKDTKKTEVMWELGKNGCDPRANQITNYDLHVISVNLHLHTHHQLVCKRNTSYNYLVLGISKSELFLRHQHTDGEH